MHYRSYTIIFAFIVINALSMNQPPKTLLKQRSCALMVENHEQLVLGIKQIQYANTYPQALTSAAHLLKSQSATQDLGLTRAIANIIQQKFTIATRVVIEDLKKRYFFDDTAISQRFNSIYRELYKNYTVIIQANNDESGHLSGVRKYIQALPENMRFAFFLQSQVKQKLISEDDAPSLFSYYLEEHYDQESYEQRFRKNGVVFSQYLAYDPERIDDTTERFWNFFDRKIQN